MTTDLQTLAPAPVPLGGVANAPADSLDGPLPAPPPGAFVLMGVPDDLRTRMVYTSWAEPPRMVMQGTAGFLGQISLPWPVHALYFGSAQLRVDARLPEVPCVNFMADADLYGMALRQAAEFVSRFGTPCFNHPLAVLGTTRDAVSRALAGVSGARVPTTVRARVRTLPELVDAMAAAGIDFPVLVRMAGDHGGISTALVRDVSGWDALNALPWGGHDIYLTQFVDFRDPDGHYRKLRLVVVGDEVFVRHRIVSADWMVHRTSRLPGTEDEEQAWLTAFSSEVKPRLLPVVMEIRKRLGLDYFGIDASLRPDGTLLIFEANACMNILVNTSDGPSSVFWQGLLTQMGKALSRLLADTGRWVGAPTIAATATATAAAGA